MTASAEKTGWIRHMLAAWRGGRQPSMITAPFLLPALDHGETKQEE